MKFRSSFLFGAFTFALFGVTAHAQDITTVEDETASTGPQTDEEICNDLIETFYLSLEENTESSLVRENDSCSCKISEDSAFFVVNCSLDYCQECNEAGVCALALLSDRYSADILRQGEGDSAVASADFFQCYDYTQGVTGTVCVITDPNQEICTMEVDGSPCKSCSLDSSICLDDLGGYSFDCTNLEGGIAFNSCNEVSDTAQAVDLNSVYAFADADSLVFESCLDPSLQVITPLPTAAPDPRQQDSSSGGINSTPSAARSAQKIAALLGAAALASGMLLI